MCSVPMDPALRFLETEFEHLPGSLSERDLTVGGPPLPRAWVEEQTRRLITSLGTRIADRAAHPIVLGSERADELRALARTIVRLLDEIDAVTASEIP